MIFGYLTTEGRVVVETKTRQRAHRRVWRAKTGKLADIYFERISGDRSEVVIDYPANNIRITFVRGDLFAVVKGTIRGESRIDPLLGGKKPINPAQEAVNTSQYVYQAMAQWAWEILNAERAAAGL